MTKENQDNNGEYKLTKPENVYVEEQQQEVVPNSMEIGINSELEKIDVNQQKFKANVASLGGEKHIRTEWDQMDIALKQQITEKIEKYSKQKEVAIGDQGFALSWFNPVEQYNQARYDEHGHKDSSVVTSVGIATLMTLMSPFLAIATGIDPTIDRIKSSIKLSREKRKLKDLEWQHK